MKRAACLLSLALGALPAAALAQQPAPNTSAPQTAAPPPALPRPVNKTGNPTPGTPQPEPPNIADRITVTGCLQMAPGAGAPPASALTVPADNRFVLNGAKKDGPVPPGTGTSPAAAAATYRLEALESQLSPVVNARVEISGEVKASAPGPPVLLVESVRKLAAKCQ